MIHYLCGSPKPVIEGSDALYNEIFALKERYNGQITQLYPFAKPSSRYPSYLYGVHNFAKIINRDIESNINHVFASSLFQMPILKLIKSPIVYNVVGGINENSKLPSISYLKRLSKIVVSNKRDQSTLTSIGLQNIELIETGIDFQNEKFDKTIKLQDDGNLTLLMASSPWELSQFQSKGIHLLLEAVQKMKNLKIIFIWRGILFEHMQSLIKKYKVDSSVQLINEKVEIKDFIQKVDGVVLLSNSSTIVKSYPHSLLEGLLSGKPIIASHTIPISDYINQYGCGLVINSLNITELQNKLNFFYRYYSKLKLHSTQINTNRFKFDKMLSRYGNLYNQVLQETKSVSVFA